MKRFFLFLFIAPLVVFGQKAITLDEAIGVALERNPAVKAAAAQTQQEIAMKGAAIEIPKTNVALMYGQYNSYRNDNNITITQNIPFPTVFGTQNNAFKMKIESAKLLEGMTKNELTYEIRRTYNRLLYLDKNQKLLEEQDSLFGELFRIATIQYKTGEGTLLQMNAAESQKLEVSHKLLRNSSDYYTALKQLQLYCQSDSITSVVGTLEELGSSIKITDSTPENNPGLLYYKHNIGMKHQEKKVESSRAYPDLLLGYFNQTLIGPQQVNGAEQFFDSSKRFQGVQVGVSIPLFFNTPRAKIRAANYAEEVAARQFESNSLTVNSKFYTEVQMLEKNKRSIDYYQTAGLKHADLLTDQSQKAFKSGELDYATLVLNLRQALTIREGYLTSLYDYNESAILLLLLTGK